MGGLAGRVGCIALVAALALPAAAAAADGRVYELVSPQDKLGADVEVDNAVRSSDGGDALTYTSKVAFGEGHLSAIVFNQLLSSRSPTGWTTTGVNPPVDPFPSAPAPDFAKYEGFSENLSRGVAYSWSFRDPGSAAPVNETYNLYLRNNATNTFSLLSLLSPPLAPSPPENPTAALRATRFVGASRDFSHIVFVSHKALTADAPPETGTFSSRYLYEWTAGTLRLVSVLPDGSKVDTPTNPPASDIVMGGQGDVTLLAYPGDHVVSGDGSRIFFSVRGVPGDPTLLKLYVRKNGTTTTQVSASQATTPEPPQSALFQFASVDGSEAFFVSREKLTDDSTASSLGPDLYRYDVDSGALTDLTTQDPDGAAVLGVVGAADDASTVYFVARGNLAAGAVDGEPNLYVWRPETGIRYVAGLSEGDGAVWSFNRANGVLTAARFRDARVTPDGGVLVFSSQRKLTEYNNAGFRQVYRYDDTSGNLDCVSCNTRAAQSTDHAWLKFRLTESNSQMWLSRSVSDDGSRVFFDSAEGLVLADINSRTDVYEWHNGIVDLVSSGRSDENSHFLDASASGRDVFFTTRERLVTNDRDALIDAYDAREGGGFPQASPNVPCKGENCQGSLSPPPTGPKPASDSFVGRGNVPQRARATFRVRKITRAQTRRLARGRAIAIRVRVNRSGRIAIVARGKLHARTHARTHVVGRAVRRATGPGVVRVRLKLLRAARARLAKGRQLRVSISVRFSDVLEAATQRRLLRSPSSPPGRHGRASATANGPVR